MAVKSNTEKFVQKASNKWNCLYNYSNFIYVNSKKKVDIICPVHGKFCQKPEIHLQGKGCPQCSESKMEKELSKFLVENNVEFEREKTFEGLIGVYKKLLRFDFWLSKQNLLIECDGPQHYKFIKGMMKDGEFKKIKEHDRRKNEYCILNNVKLLRLTKTDFKDLNTKLENYLKVEV